MSNRMTIIKLLQESRFRDYEAFRKECICYMRMISNGECKPETCRNHVVNLYSGYIKKYTGKLLLLVDMEKISPKNFSEYQKDYSDYLFNLMKNFFLNEYAEKYA